MAKVTIEYCVPCGFKPRALELKKSLEERFGAEVELVDGANGVFEVEHDGDQVFSRKATGRFPEPGEVENAIAQRAS